MSSTMTHLSADDEVRAELEAIRVLNETVSILKRERTKFVTELEKPPLAFGLSPEFAEAEAEASSVGIVWTLDDWGFFTVSY